jgi:uncharacterized membrane protein YoaK (UPF0700 family)
LYVLGGVWVWLWVALGYPPVLQFLLNTLLVIGFVVLRYGAALWHERATKQKQRHQRQRKDKRDFLLLLGGLTILIAATTIPNSPQTGVILCIALVVVGIVYAKLAA